MRLEDNQLSWALLFVIENNSLPLFPIYFMKGMWFQCVSSDERNLTIQMWQNILPHCKSLWQKSTPVCQKKNSFNRHTGSYLKALKILCNKKCQFYNAQGNPDEYCLMVSLWWHSTLFLMFLFKLFSVVANSYFQPIVYLYLTNFLPKGTSCKMFNSLHGQLATSLQAFETNSMLFKKYRNSQALCIVLLHD